MRSMSFRETEHQLKAGTKTVTRRLGWKFLKPGDQVKAVRKAQGIPKGGHQEVWGVCTVISNRWQPLDYITPADVVREGFPDMRPSEFVQFFCRINRGCTPTTMISRVEFEFTPDEVKHV